MRSYKISNKGTTSIFSNKFLEALTRTHFLVPLMMYLIASVIIICYVLYIDNSNWMKFIYMIPAGLFVFSLVEYSIHRFLFHFEPKNEKQANLKYKVHGVHHEYPRDKDRLAMPPVVSIFLALFFYGLFKIILGNDVLYFFPGFLTGYSVYLLIHYSIHRFRPPQNFLKILWTHHALHHYKDENSAYGVSMPLWDYVFRTLPSAKTERTV